MGQIYKAINKINGMIYIGKTMGSLKNRKKDHISKALRHINNTRFHNALRKYGSKNFEWEVLEKCSMDIINDREIYYIAKFSSTDKSVGYNMTLGGENDYRNNLGKKWSTKRILERSKPVYQYDVRGILIKRWDSVKLVAGYYSVDLSVIYRVCNTNKIWRGYVWRTCASKLTSVDISNFYIVKNPVYTILQYDLSGNLLNEYSSISKITSIYNIDESNINRACNGINKTSAGYIWRYKDNPLSKSELRDILKRKPMSKESIKKRALSQSKPVLQYDLQNKFIKEWVSMRKATASLGLHGGAITKVCQGKYKTTGGFIWKYKNV